MRAGVVAVARPTFDVEFAAETARRAYRVLEGTGWELAGSADLIMDGDGLDAAISDLSAEGIDGLVVLQASFADSTLVAPLSALGVPMVLWAFPEDRTGGRLRINSLCGINLAGYALSLGDTTYGFLYRDPDDPAVSQELADAFAGSPASKPRAAHADGAVAERAAEIAARLRDTKVGVIGDRPDGFEPCGFDAELTASVIGPRIEKRELPATFAAASAVAPVEIAPLRETVGERLAGIDDVDQEEVDRSLALHTALRTTIADEGWSGVAMRCWPECFTEYGSAACVAQAMLSDYGVPGCCEADAYGVLTSLVLQWLTDSSAFVADLVDLDRDSNTGVFWHCGIAPFELADPEATASAALHSNRQKPLLHEFPLKPGRVTIARFSQARGETSLVIGSGEVLRAPISFGGTSGVIRLDAPVDDVLGVVMGAGLEHHYGIGYGEVAAELEALAAELDIPVVDLTKSP